MTEHSPTSPALGHPLRVALLRLVEEQGSVTSNEAARRLGESSGACSFHLRQLARYGYLEQDGDGRGRARPWRLRGAPPAAQPDLPFGSLARELEDEGYRRWLALREQAPRHWQRDEAFSAVLYLTPDELSTVAAAVHDVLAPFRDREAHPARRPTDAEPVAFVTRMFPLLPAVPTAHDSAADAEHRTE
ncbi:helix-turn-helix domain-containing protein [Micromonospora sp. WMMD1120]|uniref:winged helix-turn-helix domain-containing protein n=1 Tax=Micromonospora sp. WMMD1120 TaxID=3016106 RepID=UPI002416754F|nr:helix-turn-helix domain-containing protein [Micromonospora sp. WMMD1120]MDG4810063.1 helix-turn-helix domain-containing protein [Micromonospora sp. WMMD1120]